jgi:kumamolisin
VNSNTTASNSTSWGSCEPDLTGATMDTFSNIFRQAAAQGQSFFAASGDYGAYDCRPANPNDTRIVVDYPASDPYMTGVGGTTLGMNVANTSYMSEAAWFSSGAPPPATGGGLSQHFALPWWQTGLGVSNGFSNGYRQVPDVALDADPNSGYSIYSTNNQPNPAVTGWFVVGGTSAAAPGWAAVAALYNQFAKSLGRGNLGFANPTLYAAAAATQPAIAFHDIVNGNNLVYQAKQGWDYPTGWGTPDVNNLVSDILVARSPYRGWLQNAAPGGSPPPGPWYSKKAAPAFAPAFPLPLAGEGRVGASTSPPPLAGAGRVGTISTSPIFPPPLAGEGRVGAFSFMAQLAGRLTTFLR